MKPLKQILYEDLEKWAKEVAPAMNAATTWNEVKALYDEHNKHVEKLKRNYEMKQRILNALGFIVCVIVILIIVFLSWALVSLLAYWTFPSKWMWVSISIFWGLRCVLLIIQFLIQEIRKEKRK